MMLMESRLLGTTSTRFLEGFCPTYPDGDGPLDNVCDKRLGSGAVGAQCRHGIAGQSHRQEKRLLPQAQNRAGAKHSSMPPLI